VRRSPLPVLSVALHPRCWAPGRPPGTPRAALAVGCSVGGAASAVLAPWATSRGLRCGGRRWLFCRWRCICGASPATIGSGVGGLAGPALNAAWPGLGTCPGRHSNPAYHSHPRRNRRLAAGLSWLWQPQQSFVLVATTMTNAHVWGQRQLRLLGGYFAGALVTVRNCACSLAVCRIGGFRRSNRG